MSNALTYEVMIHH